MNAPMATPRKTTASPRQQRQEKAAADNVRLPIDLEEQASEATTVDTTGEDAALSIVIESLEDPETTPTFELTRLAAFLHEQFPGEVGRTNTQTPEGPVDVAIRLLLGTLTRSASDGSQRCDRDYCNRPASHAGVHGWVQYTP